MSCYCKSAIHKLGLDVNCNTLPYFVQQSTFLHIYGIQKVKNRWIWVTIIIVLRKYSTFNICFWYCFFKFAGSKYKTFCFSQPGIGLKPKQENNSCILRCLTFASSAASLSLPLMSERLLSSVQPLLILYLSHWESLLFLICSIIVVNVVEGKALWIGYENDT